MLHFSILSLVQDPEKAQRQGVTLGLEIHCVQVLHKS